VTPPAECPHCQRASWLRGDPEREAVCERCGSALAPFSRRLAARLRLRLARDARRDAGRPRFVRERP
jgi:hypothetical protein